MQNFKAFDPILIRSHETKPWSVDLYDYFDTDWNEHRVISGVVISDKDILPYNEETRHLHGTVGEFTKWVPSRGEPILVKDYDHERWTLRIFVEMCNGRFATTTEPETSCYSALWDQAKPYVNPFKE